MVNKLCGTNNIIVAKKVCHRHMRICICIRMRAECYRTSITGEEGLAWTMTSLKTGFDAKGMKKWLRV